MEICKDEGEKLEQIGKTSIADKDAGGRSEKRKKKYKLRTARRLQRRKQKGFSKQRKEGLEDKVVGSDSSPCEVYEHITAPKSR